MTMACKFTFAHLGEIFDTALALGYRCHTLHDYFTRVDEPRETNDKRLVTRVDVDGDCIRARRISDLLHARGIRASFFFRLHATYNLFAFEHFNVVQDIVAKNHEIGLHTELIDMREICGRDPHTVLRDDIAMLESNFRVTIHGTAAHGDRTGFNNLDFWKNASPRDFRLIYEAYDPRLFERCLYLSDSLWTSWKAYDNGQLLAGDSRCACEHIKAARPLVNILIHPDTFYDRHFHER